VCGGKTGGVGLVSDMRRLDLATLQWEAMPSLVRAREDHVCCAVRGALVVLGGDTSGDEVISVEMLSKGEWALGYGTPALVMRRDIGRSCRHGGGERQCRGAGAFTRGIHGGSGHDVDGAPGRSGHWSMHSAAKPPPWTRYVCGGADASRVRLLRGRC